MADGVELATGFVSLVAETDALVRAVVEAMGRAGQQGGREASRAFERGFNGVGDQAAGQLSQGLGEAGRDGGRDAARAVDRALSGAGDQAGRELSDAIGEAGRDGGREAARQIESAASAGGEAGGEAGGDAMAGGIAGKLKGLAGKGGPIVAALAVAGGFAATAFLDALRDGMDREATLDMSQARLGVDDATMQRIGLAASNSFKNAFGESFEANVDTARMAAQGDLFDTDADVGEIQNVIDKLTTVNDVIEGDLKETTKAASILMKNGLAKDADEAFDIIATGYKAVGLAGDDMVDSLKEYSSGWKNSGLTAEQALGVIAQSTKDLGADSTDRAADALREFGRRVTEEGEAMVEGMDSIGLAGQDMFDTIKAGGPDAFAAFDQLFDAIRAIEDPAERGQAVLAVLGDTAGDFSDVFEALDPSAAVEAFGQIEGAADQMISTVGSNSKASIDAAMNSWSESGNQIKGVLAQVFAPAMQEVAGWISTHQPEIIGFFTMMAQAALGAGEGIGLFVEGSLRWAALLLDGLSFTVGSLAQLIGGFVSTIGDVLSAVGLDDMGEDVSRAGEAIAGFKDTLQNGADEARDMADNVGEMRRGMTDMRNELSENAGAMRDAAEVTRALGAEYTALPTDVGVTITSNDPEVKGRLEALGFTVQNLPDGQLAVSAETDEAKRMLDAFLAQTRATTAEVTVEARPGSTWATLAQMARDRGAQVAPTPSTGPWWSAGGMADGGLFRGRGGPRDDANLIRVSDYEYIEPAHVVTSETLPFLEAIRAGWVPPAELLHGMVPGFVDGGLVNAQAFARSRDDLPYQYGAVGPGAYDCSGFQSDIYAFLTGQPMGVRYFTTESDFEALGFLPGLGGPEDYSIGVMRGGGGMNSHMAGTLGDLNVEAGGNGVQAGEGAQGAAAFPLQFHLPLSGDPAGLGGGAGASSLASLGSSSTGTSAASGFGSYSVAAGDASPVFVVNWPGGTSSVNGDVPGVTGSDTSASSTSSSDSASSTGGMDWNAYGERAQNAGMDFVKANADQAISDLGVPTDGFVGRSITEGIKYGEQLATWQPPAAPGMPTPARDLAPGVGGSGPSGPSMQIGSINGLSPEAVAAQMRNLWERALMRHAGRP